MPPNNYMRVPFQRLLFECKINYHCMFSESYLDLKGITEIDYKEKLSGVMRSPDSVNI